MLGIRVSSDYKLARRESHFKYFGILGDYASSGRLVIHLSPHLKDRLPGRPKSLTLLASRGLLIHLQVLFLDKVRVTSSDFVHVMEKDHCRH
jgi:hypothetical protein